MGVASSKEPIQSDLHKDADLRSARLVRTPLPQPENTLEPHHHPTHHYEWGNENNENNENKNEESLERLFANLK